MLGALTRPGSLPPLDGLRAVAILLVLSEHIAQRLPGWTDATRQSAWLRPFHLGWIGVDLFFVLSGFLVGSIVLRGIDPGRFSFRTFYLRRFFRILPAYFTVILALVVIRYGWPEIGGVPPFALPDLIPNLLLLTDYWPRDLGVPSWSLSIEEHFYLLIPLLLLFARKFAPAAQRNLLLGFVGLGLLCRILTYHYYHLGGSFPSAEIMPLIYYPFHTRLDALAMGVLIALLHRENPHGAAGLRRNAAMAFALVLLSAVFFPGVLQGRWFRVTLQYSFLAVGFGAILWSVLPGQPATILARFLSARLWVPVARLSYAIYLTHIIVLEFASRIMPPSPLGPLFLFACCLAAALPLYLFVEEPLHRYARRVFP